MKMMNGVGAKLGADGPLLDHVKFHRQLTRSQRDSEVVRRLDREVARDLRVAAKNRLIDVWRRQNLVVEDDREWLAHILLSGAAEAASAARIELDVDVRSAVLVEALMGIG
jgi:hypothetical protein